MNRTLTNRLSARAGTQAAELIVHADAAGDAVRRIIQRSWSELWRTIRPDPHSFQSNFHNAARILTNLTNAVQVGLRDQMRGMFLWSHHRSAAAILGTLPKAYLRAAVTTKLTESRRAGGEGERVRLLEEGAVQLGLIVRDGVPEYTATDLTIDPRDEPDFWESVLFPAPPAHEVESILDRILTWPTAPTIGDTTEQSPFSLASTIAQQVAMGQSSQDIARNIRPLFDGSANKAERTARTLGAYVGTERNLATSEQLGDVVMGYQVHSAGGENARHDHAMRSGTVYYREPKQGQYGMDVMPHPPVDTGRGPFEDITGIRFNCRCVTGNSFIHGDVQSIARSFYDGEGIEIRTAGGAHLTVTANHPIATPDGFIPAGEIGKGMYALSDSISVRQFANHVGHGVAKIEDAFQAISIRSRNVCRQWPNALEFHGDGASMQGKVYIVGPDFGLMNGRDAAFVECQDEFDFIGRASHLVRRSDLSSALGVRHGGPFQGFRSGPPANRYACVEQHANDSKRLTLTRPGSIYAAAVDTERFGQRGKRFPSQITSNERGRTWYRLGELRRFRCRSECDPAIGKPGFDGCAFDAKFASNLVKRHAGFISLDQIIDVRRYHLQAFVYSVDTGLGYYMGSSSRTSIVQGNCWVSPVLAPLPAMQTPAFTENAQKLIPDVSHFADWFEKASTPQRRAAAGVRRIVTAAEVLGREPTWADLVDSKTGKLLTLAELKNETPAQQLTRVAAVQVHINRNRAAVQAVAAFGTA